MKWFSRIVFVIVVAVAAFFIEFWLFNEGLMGFHSGNIPITALESVAWVDIAGAILVLIGCWFYDRINEFVNRNN